MKTSIICSRMGFCLSLPGVFRPAKSWFIWPFKGGEASRVLLIGNGPGGALAELLKYPGLTVDYVELDPQVIDLVQDHFPPRLVSVLRNKRVNIVHTDARLLVKRTDERYDALILNVGDPSSALINRFYTTEFYREARHVLEPEGVLAFAVSSSANYLNEENKDFLRTINTTLRTEFSDVRSVPGDSHVFLAALRPGVIAMDHGRIEAALKSMDINTDYFALDLPSRMNTMRLQQINDVLKTEGRINRDLKPVAYLYDVLLWSTHFNTSLRQVFLRLRGLTVLHLMAVPLLVLAIGVFFRKRAVDLSIVTTGFSEIVFQVLVILAFQSLYGYVYYRIGLIMASFMAGLVLGVNVAQRTIVNAPDKVWSRYRQVQVMICVYPLLLPLVFTLFAQTRVGTLPLAPFVFTLLPIVAGAIGGFQYPLAVQLKSRGEQAQAPAAALYALDVLGAALGALVTATVLIPLLGVTVVAIFCAVLNAAVLGVLVTAGNKRRRE